MGTTSVVDVILTEDIRGIEKLVSVVEIVDIVREVVGVSEVDKFVGVEVVRGSDVLEGVVGGRIVDEVTLVGV